MPFTPIGDALQGQHGKDSPLKKQADSGQAVEAAEKVFKEIFDEELAIHAKPLFLKNRTLTVTCTSSALAQEIRTNQQKIVKQINDEVGEKVVDRIRYLS